MKLLVASHQHAASGRAQVGDVAKIEPQVVRAFLNGGCESFGKEVGPLVIEPSLYTHFQHVTELTLADFHLWC